MYCDCHPDLLDIFFGPDVRWVHKGAHDLQVAMDNEGLVRSVCIDTDSPVVVDGVWQLSTLPQHLVVAFKLAWVGCLSQRSKEGDTKKTCDWDFENVIIKKAFFKDRCNAPKNRLTFRDICLFAFPQTR